MSNLLLKPGARVLFQGDSITDCGRDRADIKSLGPGYPNFIARWLSAKYPEAGLEFINRGNSGDRVYDLEARWTEDCINHKPDLVSILIGINDTWRRYDSDTISSMEDYDASYRRILDRVKAETNAGIVILEPFLLPTDEDRAIFREDLDPRIQVTRKISREYGALFIPLDGLFAAASMRREPAFWSPDGVHPSDEGHALIAQKWIKAVVGTGNDKLAPSFAQN